MTADARLIADRYRLEQQIGAGAMGVVWRAHDVRLDRTVAVKQLLMQPGLDETETAAATARAMREGRIAARLQHPHAISVYDVALDDIDDSAVEGQPVPWLIMEYLPSRSLAAVLNEHGTLPPRDVARIGRQVAAALAAAHSAGIVHRDVKPGNVLLGTSGIVKITDFGISRASWEAPVTRTGVVAGTPAYFAPEVARGEPRDPAADVFSLGSTLYAAVEGEPPFGLDDNTLALLRTVAEGRVRAPQQAGPLSALLMRMLRDDPTQRPSMREAVVALGAVAHGGVPTRLGRPAASRSMVDLRSVPPQPRSPQDRTTQDDTTHDSTTQRTVRQHTPAPDRPERDRAEQDKSERNGQRHRPGQHSVAPPSLVPSRTTRRRRVMLLGAAACVLVLIGVLALAVQGSGRNLQTSETFAEAPNPSPTIRPTTPPATAPLPSTPPGPAELEQTMRTYYGLLPDNAAAAWELLGASERAKARDFAQYLDFWRGIARVRIRGPVAVQGNTVLANLQFDTKDGRQTFERYQFDLNAAPDGRVLIESSTLINSVEASADNRGGRGNRNNGDGNNNNGNRNDDNRDRGNDEDNDE